MRVRLKRALDELEKYPKLVKAALMESKKDTEMVDVIGTIKAVERAYKPMVAGAITEVAPLAGGAMRGETHHVETKRSATRSYNTPRLMKLMQDNGFTILDLLDIGVITIQWNWTPLKQFVKRQGIELTIVEKEVPEMGKADGDVGEWWKDGYPRWT